MDHSQKEKDWIAFYKTLKGRRDPGFVTELDPDVISVDLADQSMIISFNTKDYMRNPAKVVHGGVIAGMADSAMGILAIILHEGTYGVTADMTISFLRPVPMHTKIFVRSKCWKSGKTLTFMTCEGYLEESPDEVLFTASSRYMLVPDMRLEDTFTAESI